MDAWTVSVFQRLGEDRGPYLMVEQRPGSSAVIGCAFDNFAPLPLISVRLDYDVPFSLAVDDKGWFSLPPSRRGHHDVVLVVTNATGRSSSARMTVIGDALP